MGFRVDFIYKTQPNDKPIQWSPVRTSNDVSWNFEKFIELIKKACALKTFKRYLHRPKFENKDIVPQQ